MRGKFFNQAVIGFAIIFVLGLSLMLSGCGAGGVGGTGGGGTMVEAAGTIDADGGSIEVTDPSSQLAGVKVEIPAGTLDRQAQISVETLSSIPAPANSSVQTNLPFTLKIEGAQVASDGNITVTYPVPRDANQILALGYYQDGEYIVNLAGLDNGGATISSRLPVGSLNRDAKNKSTISYAIAIAQFIIHRLNPGSSPGITVFKWNGSGWTPTSESWSGNVALLVHGIFSTDPQEAFTDMAKYLADPVYGFDYNNIYLVYYPTGYKIDDLGKSLGSVIDSHCSIGCRLNIYAHSMGGLVARSAIESHHCDNPVVLITFGTPHKGVLGSIIASLIVNYRITADWIPEFDDLIPASPFLNELNQPSATSVSYGTIAGTNGSGLVWNTLTNAIYTPLVVHDGLVAEFSAAPDLSQECQYSDKSYFPVHHDQLIHDDPVFGQLNDWLVNSFKGKYVFNSCRNGSWDVFIVNSKARNVSGRAIFETSNVFDYAGGAYNGGASPSGQEMVISSQRDNQDASELYLINFNGGVTRKLTNDSYADYYPCFSRDGQKIVYLSQRENNRVAICEIRRDGSGAREIATLITKSDFDGPLGPDEQKLCGYIHVSYSPDGNKILFNDLMAEQYKDQFDLDIFTINTDGSGRTAVYYPTGMDSYACYGENAQTIYFTTGGDCVAKLTLGTTPPIYLTDTDNYSWAPYYMQDGGIFFITSRDGNNNMYRMDRNGSNQVCVVNSPGDDRGKMPKNACREARIGLGKEELIKRAK